MSNSKITWFIQNEDEQFMAAKSYTEEGSYTPGEYLVKNIQIWNNYNGNEDVDETGELQLVVSFKNYEDNFLLNLLEISINNNKFKKLNIDVDKGYISIGNLTGGSNTGQSNSSNCKNIKIKIGPIPNNIRSDFKTMIFYLTNNIISENSVVEESTYTRSISQSDISEIDKYYVDSSNAATLSSAYSYVDEKIKEILGSTQEDSIPKTLDTLKELADALNNNPNFAKEQELIQSKLENQIAKVETITKGLDKPIKDYIDNIDPSLIESFTEQELLELIENIKNILNNV